MLAVKSMDVRENFKEWCNKVIGGETLIVSRPRNENVVIVSEKEYNEMAKAKRNAEYLAMLDRSYTPIHIRMWREPNMRIEMKVPIT